VQEAIAEIERGDFMDIDDAFDRVISKYED